MIYCNSCRKVFSIYREDLIGFHIHSTDIATHRSILDENEVTAVIIYCPECEDDESITLMDRNGHVAEEDIDAVISLFAMHEDGILDIKELTASELLLINRVYSFNSFD